jgi:mannosyl-3-phosphoglycerate phosphatase
MKSSSERWAVFTDLDGTLLDHATYKWHEARPAINAMRRARVPLIVVTSKTRAEVMALLRGLKLPAPFVVENGGAIYVPKGYFQFRIPGASPAGRGWLRIALGTPRQRLVRALASAAKRAGTSIRSFSEMSAREIAECTGLSPANARRARRREFDEPFVILSGGSAAASRLKQEITRTAFHMTRGSRFFHILGKNDKGTAVRKLLAFYRQDLQTQIQSVGLGDSPNDIPLLQAVDRPILVARPGGRYDTEVLRAIPRVTRAGGVGPVGWNRALLQLFSAQVRDPSPRR